MAFKIIWSKEAEDIFDNIVNYLELNWTETEIRKFITETESITSRLKQKPFLFRGSEKENIYEVLVGKKKILLYQVNKKLKRVELLSFWDGRQNPNSKFKIKL